MNEIEYKNAEIEETIKKEKKNRIKWGFIWAGVCALFWGLGYIPMTIIWGVPPFVEFPWFDGSQAYLVSGVLIAGIQAIVFAIVLFFFWAGLTGKIKESIKTLTHVKISKWLLLGAICGGPCAIYGSTIAIGYIGAAFAAAMGLMSAIVGALVARAWYHERFTKKTVAGIGLLLLGGLVILNPIDMINSIADPASPDGVVFGYVGAILSAIGWGLEGCFAVRALDVTDADSSLPVRYIWESIIWIIIIFPIIGLIAGPADFFPSLWAALTSTSFIFWTVIAAFCLGMCYAAMYKCYPLIGVGRTLSLTALYVPVSIIALLAFFGVLPVWWIIIGAAISVVGMFVMYWESDTIAESTRDLGGE